MSDEVEQIKERLDIAELVGEYVQLKQAGRSFKGLCPFHQEKTPSFVVTPERGIWHCFGCGEGGDVLSFVQKVEGMDFRAALTMLAERAGVELTRQSSAQARVTKDTRERRYELMGRATQFYHHLLTKHEGGKKALEYLRERGVTDTTIARFEIGYAPKAWDLLQQWLRKEKFTPAEMVATGLVGESARGTLFDRFRGRIMWPIQDRMGRTVAFGGRIVPWLATGEEGKYVNSPETELYRKRRVLYNLQRARDAIREEQVVIVVEGYMDVVMLDQIGIRNVVAASGTAFTPEHVQSLQRLASELRFAFDADGAGLKAAVVATEAALQAGVRVGMVALPAGTDPADMAKDDPEALKRLMAEPRSLVSVLMDQLNAADTAVERERLLDLVVPFVAWAKNPIQQGELVAELAGLLHVPEAVVVERLQSVRSPTLIDGGETDGVMKLNIERYTLGLVFLTEAREELWGQLKGEWFLDEQLVVLYNSLQDLARKDLSTFLTMSTETLISSLPEGQRSLAETLHAAARDHVDLEQIAKEVGLVAGRLRQHSLRRRLQGADVKLADVAQITQQLADIKVY